MLGDGLGLRGGMATMGASFRYSTLSMNGFVAVSPPLSVAITSTMMASTSLVAGVPLKLAVTASNVSHVGNGLPSTSCAE